MMIECKRPDMALGQDVFNQIAQYNSIFGARYLWITNGKEHRIVLYNTDFSGYAFVDELPKFNEL